MNQNRASVQRHCTFQSARAIAEAQPTRSDTEQEAFWRRSGGAPKASQREGGKRSENVSLTADGRRTLKRNVQQNVQ